MKNKKSNYKVTAEGNAVIITLNGTKIVRLETSTASLPEEQVKDLLAILFN